MKTIVKLTKRNKEICRLREEGVTWTEVAEKYGISLCRVGVIHRQMKERLENYDDYPPLYKRLNGRARSMVAMRLGMDFLEDPQKLVDLGWEKVWAKQGVGANVLNRDCDGFI
jgi:transcriptional regulator